MIGDRIRANADFPLVSPEKTSYVVIGGFLAVAYVLVLVFAVLVT
ncbi:MAG: hypothetical protein SV760_09410 [Halobacteria archaeon]|nr:hypothetical protein [Halobacteria archaeon]